MRILCNCNAKDSHVLSTKNNSVKANTAKMDWSYYRNLGERLPKKHFYGELQAGKHSQGGWKNTKKTPSKRH